MIAIKALERYSLLMDRYEMDLRKVTSHYTDQSIVKLSSITIKYYKLRSHFT